MKACAWLFGLLLCLNLLVNCRSRKDPTLTASSASASSPAKSAEPRQSGQDKRSAYAAAAKQLVSVYTELASVHDKHANSCETLVNELREFRERNRKQLRAESGVFAAIETDAVLAKAMHAAMERVMSVSMRCRGVVAFDAFYAERATN
jgi:hypothetical protein